MPSRSVREAFLKSVRPPEEALVTISSSVSVRKSAALARIPPGNLAFTPASYCLLRAGRNAKLSPVAPPGR